MPPPAPLKVLYVDHVATMGGGEIALYNLVNALDPSQVHPSVLLFSHGVLEDRLRQAGIETHVLPLSSRIVSARKDSLGPRTMLRLGDVLKTLLFVAKLTLFMRQHPADIVHTNSLKSDILGGIAARLAGRKLVWHVRDRIASDYLPSLVVKLFQQLARRLPHVVVANSHATLSTLAPMVAGYVVASGTGVVDEKRRFASGATRIVYDGVPVNSVPANESPVNEASPGTATNVPGPGTAAAPVVGLVGRIARWKGQHIFIRAAQKVLKTFPGTRFQIIGAPLFGEEDYEQEIKQLAQELGLGERMAFLGFRTDVPELIHHFTILVHASTTGEPFGQVIIEGMAAGKPVVATRGGGVPEIVVDGQTGILVPMDDAGALARAVEWLLANPGEAHNMGEAGRQRVINHFTIEHAARRIEHLYVTMLEKNTHHGA